MPIRKLFFFLCSVLFIPVHAQNLDSLHAVWCDAKQPDTVRLKAHHIFARALVDINSDSAIIELQKEIDFAVDKQSKKYESMAYSTMGLTYYFRGEFNTSISNYKKSLVIDQELGDKKGQATSLNNIGNNFKMKGDYASSIMYYQESMRLKEQLKDAKGIGTSLNNIGLIYKEEGDYESAMADFRKSYFIQDSIGNKKGMANAASNMGEVYQLRGKNDSALFYYEKCRALEEILNDQDALAGTLNNIGGIYRLKGDLPKAEEILRSALAIADARGRKVDLATCYSSLGMLNNQEENFRQGKEFCLRSLQIAEEIESNELLRDDCLCLSDAYEGVGDHTTAFSYYKRYVGYKDSLTNAEHLKAITKTVVKFELEKKSSADSIKAVADKKISDAELQLKDSKLQQEKYLRIYLITGIFLMIITIIIVYRRFRITRTQKRIIEEQKNIVVEKQKEIIDSINYAKKIQMALLKEEEHVSVHLPPHFIFYRPRDIVSGDFYWAMEKQGQLYIAAADCTGHGVPGAFLTMLGIAFLNEINSGDKPLPPSRILEKLRDHFITELSQHGKDHSSFDGMDISLARLDLKTKEVAWCGANNPLYCFINGEFTEFKPNKQPVGFSYEMKAFEDRIIKMNSGDTLYLFTDGFADQFGGPKGKKFKYSRLIETLRSLQDKNMEQQKEELTRVFDDWKGNYEQIDDVCIVGLRL